MAEKPSRPSHAGHPRRVDGADASDTTVEALSKLKPAFKDGCLLRATIRA